MDDLTSTMSDDGTGVLDTRSGTMQASAEEDLDFLSGEHFQLMRNHTVAELVKQFKQDNTTGSVPNTQQRSKVEVTEVELICYKFLPTDLNNNSETTAYLEKALECCENVSPSDFFIKSTWRTGREVRVAVICSNVTQAHKIVLDINKKTTRHNIRAQVSHCKKELMDQNDLNETFLPSKETNRKRHDSSTVENAIGQRRRSRTSSSSQNVVSPGCSTDQEDKKQQNATRKKQQKTSKMIKTEIELDCSEYPHGNREDNVKAMGYLREVLGSCKGFKMADLNVENVAMEDKTTKIRVACVSRAKAKKITHEINKNSKLLNMKGRMIQPQKMLSESVESQKRHEIKRQGGKPTSGRRAPDRDFDKIGKENAHDNIDRENQQVPQSVAIEHLGQSLERAKMDALRKFVNISSVALKQHYDKINEKEEILRNLERLDRIRMEEYEETETKKLVHQQKLEELVNQRLEYETYCRNMIEKVNQIELEKGDPKEFDQLIDLCRLETKKLKSALPIYACKSNIISSVVENDFLVLLGETGSGKSTQTPQYLCGSDLGKEGMIACIQPRQVAAISLACQVAKEMGTHVGGLVGYKAGYNNKVGPSTKVVYTTNHAMLKEIIKDPLLKEYSCVLVDEAHERSIYCDLLLGMIKEAKQNRPDLKVVVMSATIDPKLFVDYFNGCPIVKVSGRTFPVDLDYKMYDDDDNKDNYLREAIEKAKQVHRAEPPGDILVFLTSPAEIEKAVQEMEKQRGVLSLPLHGRLQPDQQKQVFNPTPTGIRKIVFATNAAETSITIPGIKYVVDTGKAKEMHFDSTKGISSLEVQWISRSSADQRKGRAGRIESGKCFRLYTEEIYNSMDVGSVPEILKSSTEMAFLTLMTLGVDDPTKFDFVEAPSRQVMDHAMKELYQLGAILPEGGLTELGKQLAVLNVEPKYGKLLFQAVEQGIGFSGMVVTALLTVGSSIFFRMGSPTEKQMADKKKTRFCSSKGDIYTTYEVFKEWYGVQKNKRSTWCVENSINAKSMRMCLDFVNDLNTTLKKELKISVDTALFDASDISEKLDRLLIECYRKNLACYTGHSKSGYYVPYLESNIVIHPSSSVQMLKEEPQWIVYASILETGKKYLMNSTVIDADLVEEVFGQEVIEGIKHRMMLLHLNLIKVYTEMAGQSVLSRMIGARGINIQRIMREIKEKHLGEIEFALDVSVSSCQLNFFCSPNVSQSAVEYLQSELLSLKADLIKETVEDKLVPNSEVYYILEEGATLKTVLMAEDYRTIVIQRSPPGVTDTEILERFSTYGKIQRHFVFKPRPNGNQTGWGKIMYEDETVAKHVMHRYRTKSDPELSHFGIEPEERRMSSGLSTNLSFSWMRRRCTGLGFLAFSDYGAAEHALECLRMTGTDGFSVCPSRKNNTELVMKNVLFSLREDDVKKIVDRAVPHARYDVRLIRQAVIPESDELVEATKQELLKKIRDETLQTTFHLHLAKPKEKSFDWYGHIKTPNTEIAQTIYGICLNNIFMGDHCVKFELKLSGKITLNQRLFQRMQVTYQRLIAEASIKYRPAQLTIEQGNNRLFYLHIRAPDASAFTEISKLCNELAFGSVLPIPSEIEVDVLGSQKGREFLGSLEQQFHCVVEVDKRNRGVRMYVNGQIRDQVKERIEHFLENNRGRISRKLELIGDDKPRGIMKYLIKAFGPTLQRFVDKTKVDCAEIQLREHILMMTGTAEAVASAIEEVEKASKDLLENPPDEGPAFTDECPICLCPITEKIYYMERCGHPYCHDCVKALVTNAGRNKDLPITCAKEDCGEKIVVKDIKNLFHVTDEAYKSLIDAALEKYVLLNNQTVKYCLTADCKMVYKATGSKKLYECPACFARICRSCHSPSHEGLSCDTTKILSSDEDRGVGDWLKENKRDRCMCPNCNALIEKSGGCNHMTCHLCNKHFCWICKKAFTSSQETYAHLGSTHGGFV